MNSVSDYKFLLNENNKFVYYKESELILLDVEQIFHLGLHTTEALRSSLRMTEPLKNETNSIAIELEKSLNKIEELFPSLKETLTELIFKKGLSN